MITEIPPISIALVLILSLTVLSSLITSIDLIISKNQKKAYEHFIDNITLKFDKFSPSNYFLAIMNNKTNKCILLVITLALIYTLSIFFAEWAKQNYLLQFLCSNDGIDLSQNYEKFKFAMRFDKFFIIPSQTFFALVTYYMIKEKYVKVIYSFFAITFSAAFLLEIIFSFNGFSGDMIIYFLKNGGFENINYDSFIQKLYLVKISRISIISFSYCISLIILAIFILIYFIFYNFSKAFTFMLWRITEYKDGYTKATILLLTIIINISLTFLIYTKGYF